MVLLFLSGDFIFIYLLAVLGLHVDFSVVEENGNYSLVAVPGLLLHWLLLLQSVDSRAQGLQELWHSGLVALWSVESSCTRDQTPVPCIGRRTLNH